MPGDLALIIHAASVALRLPFAAFVLLASNACQLLAS